MQGHSRVSIDTPRLPTRFNRRHPLLSQRFIARIAQLPGVAGSRIWTRGAGGLDVEPVVGWGDPSGFDGGEKGGELGRDRFADYAVGCAGAL